MYLPTGFFIFNREALRSTILLDIGTYHYKLLVRLRGGPEVLEMIVAEA